MNFKLKALVAAFALAAIAGQASADIQSGAANPSNGELVFYAYGTDASGNVFSYAKDLGVSFNTFLATPSYAAANLSLDANWTTFTSAAHTGDEFWGVFATQRLASATSTAANAFSLLTTAQNNDISGVSGLINSKLGNAYNAANNVIGQINAGGTNYAANNSYFFAAAPVSIGTAVANIGAYLGSDFSTSGAFINSTNVLGTTTTASFFDIARGAGTNAAGVPTVGSSVATWSLSNNVLMTAAVPEPETYAMMAAGLLMLGAVARRRRG